MMAAKSFTERKALSHMDYRSTHAVGRRRDPRDGPRAPRPATTDRPATGPNMTEMIHRELFSDYRPTGPK